MVNKDTKQAKKDVEEDWTSDGWEEYEKTRNSNNIDQDFPEIKD